MLPSEIEQLYNDRPEQYSEKQFQLFDAFKSALNEGTIRAAVPDIASASGWRVNDWVKKGILAGFRMGRIVDYSVGGGSAGKNQIPFFDKSTYPPQKITLERGVRIVPGGSSIRDACYIGRGVICMPPMFVNAGAYVDEGTMIDSHALVGSCAQVGKNCHISAAAQIGGVLEPVGALPVIIEDNVLVGGQCGIYGTRCNPRSPRRPSANHPGISSSGARLARRVTSARKSLGPFPLHPSNSQISRFQNRLPHSNRRSTPLSL
jgi:2,3,4,5-tetrahydropyridine-2-carboxylate N-succinyltransferase